MIRYVVTAYAGSGDVVYSGEDEATALKFFEKYGEMYELDLGPDVHESSLIRSIYTTDVADGKSIVDVMRINKGVLETLLGYTNPSGEYPLILGDNEVPEPSPEEIRRFQ